jgi:4-amino-4-deoxy-L-arabinose transferase-like glycosyltransferase
MSVTGSDFSAAAGELASRARRWWAAAALALALGLAFQGTRGLWEPDEGFYAGAALDMVASGDWWVPRLHGVPFLDKPPLNYWGMAAGMAAFGIDEWSVRAANAVWFALTALLVGLLAERLWGGGRGEGGGAGDRGPAAAVAYSLTLAPFLAANVVTPDTVLTVCVAAAMAAYWHWFGAEDLRGRLLGALGLGVAAGLGLLAKGPAMLVFLAPLAIHLLGCRRVGWALRRPELIAAAALSLGLAGSWYASVAAQLPGGLDYFLRNQATGRLLGGYGRNPGWTGPFVVYLPTLLVGALPWSLGWPARWVAAWRSRGLPRTPLRQDPARFLVVLWIAIPLVVFSLAQSRLPLYILPLFPALVLAAVRGAAPGRLPLLGRHLVVIAATAALLLALKAGAAYWPSSRDSRLFAAALHRAGAGRETPVVAVGSKRNALPFYGFDNFIWVRVGSDRERFFDPPLELGEAIAIAAERGRGANGGRFYVLVKGDTVDRAIEAVVKAGATVDRRAGPFDYALLVCEPAVATPVSGG